MNNPHWLGVNVAPQPKSSRKKKKGGQIFDSREPHPPTLFNPHHLSHKYLYSLWPAIPFLSFVSFFFSQTHKHTFALSHRYLHATISTIIFSSNVIEKFLGTSKHLHLLFKVKFLILLVCFMFCLRLYFYLNFNNDTHVIYKH